MEAKNNEIDGGLELGGIGNISSSQNEVNLQQNPWEAQ